MFKRPLFLFFADFLPRFEVFEERIFRSLTVVYASYSVYWWKLISY